MKYYTQQDLCKEFGKVQQTISSVSKRLKIGVICGRKRIYSCIDKNEIKMYFDFIKYEGMQRLRALLIENYQGIKIKEIYKQLRRNGVSTKMVSNAILELTDGDDRVWEQWDDIDLPDDPKWYDTCVDGEELQEKRDERDYMESTLCYGYAWWYKKHPEFLDEDDKILEVNFGRKKEDYESAESN